MLNMKYTLKFVGNNMYQIKTTFNNELITFNVVVVKDISEIDALVSFKLNELTNQSNYQNINVA